MNNPNGSLGAMLRELVEGRMEAKRKEQDAKDKLIRAGYSTEEVKQFGLLRESMDDIAGTLACTLVLARNRKHLPSAHTMLQLATYTRDAVAWMYEALAIAGVDPEVFGMQGNPTSFYRLMDEHCVIAQRVIDEAKAAQPA